MKRSAKKRRKLVERGGKEAGAASTEGSRKIALAFEQLEKSREGRIAAFVVLRDARERGDGPTMMGYAKTESSRKGKIAVLLGSRFNGKRKTGMCRFETAEVYGLRIGGKSSLLPDAGRTTGDAFYRGVKWRPLQMLISLTEGEV